MFGALRRAQFHAVFGVKTLSGTLLGLAFNESGLRDQVLLRDVYGNTLSGEVRDEAMLPKVSFGNDPATCTYNGLGGQYVCRGTITGTGDNYRVPISMTVLGQKIGKLVTLEVHPESRGPSGPV